MRDKLLTIATCQESPKSQKIISVGDAAVSVQTKAGGGAHPRKPRGAEPRQGHLPTQEDFDAGIFKNLKIIEDYFFPAFSVHWSGSKDDFIILHLICPRAFQMLKSIHVSVFAEEGP